MPMKNLNITLTVIVLFCSSLGKAQELFSERNEVIKNFISSVFKENKGSDFVIKNYIYIAPNDTVPLMKRESIIANMVDSLKLKKGKLMASSNYRTFTYDSFKGVKKKFSGDSKDIIIASVNNVPVIYFYFNKDRISSFTIIEKGSYGYFVIL